jgi:hypothetical protein
MTKSKDGSTQMLSCFMSTIKGKCKAILVIGRGGP